MYQQMIQIKTMHCPDRNLQWQCMLVSKRQVAATQESTASGQLSDHKENTENARTKGRPEDTTAEIERGRPEEGKEEDEEVPRCTLRINL